VTMRMAAAAGRGSLTLIILSAIIILHAVSVSVSVSVSTSHLSRFSTGPSHLQLLWRRKASRSSSLQHRDDHGGDEIGERYFTVGSYAVRLGTVKVSTASDGRNGRFASTAESTTSVDWGIINAEGEEKRYNIENNEAEVIMPSSLANSDRSLLSAFDNFRSTDNNFGDNDSPETDVIDEGFVDKDDSESEVDDSESEVDVSETEENDYLPEEDYNEPEEDDNELEEGDNEPEEDDDEPEEDDNEPGEGDNEPEEVDDESADDFDNGGSFDDAGDDVSTDVGSDNGIGFGDTRHKLTRTDTLDSHLDLETASGRPSRHKIARHARVDSRVSALKMSSRKRFSDKLSSNNLVEDSESGHVSVRRHSKTTGASVKEISIRADVGLVKGFVKVASSDDAGKMSAEELGGKEVTKELKKDGDSEKLDGVPEISGSNADWHVDVKVLEKNKVDNASDVPVDGDNYAFADAFNADRVRSGEVLVGLAGNHDNTAEDVTFAEGIPANNLFADDEIIDVDDDDEVSGARDPALENEGLVDGAAGEKRPDDRGATDGAADDEPIDDEATDDESTDKSVDADDESADVNSADDKVSGDEFVDDEFTDFGAVDEEATDDEATVDEATDDEATDDEATDDEATDDEAIDDEATDDEVTDDEAPDDEATDDDDAADDDAADDDATDGDATDDDATDDDVTNDEVAKEEITEYDLLQEQSCGEEDLKTLSGSGKRRVRLVKSGSQMKTSTRRFALSPLKLQPLRKHVRRLVPTSVVGRIATVMGSALTNAVQGMPFGRTFVKYVMKTPPIARVYTLATLSVSLVSLAFMNNDWPVGSLDFRFFDVVFRFQFWRVLTGFMYFGSFSINFLLTLHFVWEYFSQLEKIYIQTPEEFGMLLIFSVASLCLCYSVLGLNSLYLGHNLSSVLVYVWSRLFEGMNLTDMESSVTYTDFYIGMDVSIMGLFTIKAELLPWFFCAQGLLMDGLYSE
jgi:hypothetical protein